MDNSLIFKIRMGPKEVEQYQHFLMDQYGLVFEGRRIVEMERAVARRMIELGYSSFAEYFHYLSGTREGKEELNQLVISLTVGETQFFRTPDQFAALRKFVLPELIQRNRKTRELRLLSAGCATGEEPYTLLILLHDLLPDLLSWRITIRACDINQEFLAQARAGVYGERKLKLVDPRTRERFFERLGKNRWRVREFLKERVDWAHFNLNTQNYFPLTQGEPFDLALCRNVLIYFNLSHIKAVIKRFHQVLKPNGYLFLGYSETLFKIDDSFQSIHTPEAFFYQKAERPTPPAAELPSLPGPHPREEILAVLGSKPHPWMKKGAEQGLRDLRDEAPDQGLREGPRPQPPPRFKPLEPLFKDQPAIPPAPPPERPATTDAETTEDQLWEQALELFSTECFESAKQNFETMIALNPNSARGHLGLGFLYANLGVEDRSRRHAEEARRYDDLLPELYFLLALLDEKNADFERAIANYQRVLLLSPEFAMAHFNLGNLYLKLHAYRDARREFGNTIAALERDPGNRSLRFSGGLSGSAVISFCGMQRKQIARTLPQAGKAG